MNMKEQMMVDYPPSLAAAKKLSGKPHPDFSFYAFEWLGDKPEEWTTMKVTGAQFREAMRGPNKGQKAIKVPGTERTVYISKQDIQRAARRLKKPNHG